MLYEKGFRLKGKGAMDKGELIPFSEVKTTKVFEDSMAMVTFNKDRYELSNAGTFWDQFLRDFYRVRNEFLQEALFMKQGSQCAEFEGSFQRINVHDEVVSKGRAKLRLYDRSLVIIPERQDAFCLPFSFVKNHEIDEDEYVLQIEMDTGSKVIISQLGDNFGDFAETFNGVLSKMYDGIFKEFEYTFLDTNISLLVKLAALMKAGKAVRFKDIQKIDKTLAQKFLDLVLQNPLLKDNFSLVLNFPDLERTFLGLFVTDGKHDQYLFTIMHAAPEKNMITVTIGTRDKDVVKLSEMYFFKIIMEQGDAFEKVPNKVLELNQALLNLHFVVDPLWRDKRELRRSPYKFAIRKLPYLRILRRSYVGRAPQYVKEMFQKYLERAVDKCRLRAVQSSELVTAS